jgi:hypothetical protein
MSKKGHKGRSRKKASVAEHRPEAATASVPATVDAAPVIAASASLETPIAFEAPRVVEPVASAEGSIPPVDLDSRFFATDAHHHEVDDEHEERDPRMVLKLAPAAAKRRAQFQRYVKLAVGAASVLCLAALVKVAVAHNHEEPVVRRASASMQVAPPPPAAPVATETAPAVAPAEAVAEPTPEPAVATEPDPKAAAKEKHASQLALERGKAADAVEAGERSVALDPSDAEAWLILGAAYQEKGDVANARRSFKSCLVEGKRGPKWECAQMPH